MKRSILLLVAVCFCINGQGQEEKKSFWEGTKLEFSVNPIFGLGLKGKKFFMERPHIDGYTGFAGYFSPLPFFGYDGAYWMMEFDFFPSKKKHFFIRLEPFIGLTRFRTRSKVDLLDLDIVGSYSTSYAYFHCGTIQSLGWKFNRFSVALDYMVSFKGLLDKGPLRFGDADSLALLGISFAWFLENKT